MLELNNKPRNSKRILLVMFCLRELCSRSLCGLNIVVKKPR